MLTTNRTPRARLLAGAGALVLLTTAGLGLTASGAPAAATVRTTVKNATGLDLAALDVAAPAVPVPPSSAVPVAPAPSSAVPVLVEPSTAPMPITGENGVTTTVSSDGKAVRKAVRIVVRDKDGKPISSDDRVAADMPDMPKISQKTCKDPGDGAFEAEKIIINELRDGKRQMVICVNRISNLPANGTAIAMNQIDLNRWTDQKLIKVLQKKREMVASSKQGNNQAALDFLDKAIKETEEDLAKIK